jgi:signal peptidase II
MSAPRWAWWLSGLTLALDQATKHLAEALLVMHEPVPVLPSFNLTLTYNTGAAFSFLAGAGGWQRWFFLGLGLVVSIGLIVWLGRLKPTATRLVGGRAGADFRRALIGNLIDRDFVWTSN